MTEQAKHSTCKFYDPDDRTYYDCDIYYIADLNLVEESHNGKVGYVGQGFLDGGRPIALGQGKVFGDDKLGTINAEFVDSGIIDGYCRIFHADYIHYCNFFLNPYNVPDVSARAIPHRFRLHYDLKNATAQFTLYDPTARNIIDRFNVTQAGMNILKQDLDFRRSHAKSCADRHGEFYKSSFDDTYHAGSFSDGKINWGIQKKENSYYIGEFFLNDPYGWGKDVYNNGIYVGEHQWGKRQWFGVYRWNDGDEYIGTWKDGNMHGYGIYFYKDGYYAGEWKNDQRDGYGTYVWNDGSRRSGRYSNGKFVG